MRKIRLDIFFFLTIVTLCTAKAQRSPLRLADSLYSLGNYTQAINEYAKTPSSYSGIQIAKAYNAIGNFDKAILQYEAILLEYNEIYTAHYDLGKLYYKIRKFDKAIEKFRYLIEKDDENPRYYYDLGLVYTALDEPSESVDAYRKAINLDSTHLNSLYQLGRYFLTEHLKDSVIKYADQGLRFYENSVRLINLKAQAAYNNQNYTEALPLLEKLVELGQYKIYIFEHLGYCYGRAFEYEKAIEAYEKVLTIDPGHPKALNGLGHIYWKKKEYDKAVEYINASIESQKVTLDKEYVALARVYLDLKNIKKAIEYYKLAYEEAPENFFYSYQIAFLSDNYYKDPKIKLHHYEHFKEKFGDKKLPFNDFVNRRISELKTEIHLSSE